MESLRCIFTQIAITFKHDLRLSKCQSSCSDSLVYIENERIQHFSSICTLLSQKYLNLGVCFKFENPACDVTAP